MIISERLPRRNVLCPSDRWHRIAPLNMSVPSAKRLSTATSSPARAVAICVHAATELPQQPSPRGNRPAHPPSSLTLSRRQRTLPPSLQDFALLQMRTNVSRQWWLHLSHPSPLCIGLLKIALVSFLVPRLLWLAPSTSSPALHRDVMVFRLSWLAKLAARFPPLPSIGWWFCDVNHRLPPRARFLSSSQLLLFPRLLFSLLYSSPFLLCPHTPLSSRPLYATERTALGGAWSLGCQNGLWVAVRPGFFAEFTNKQTGACAVIT